jgi:hypothetical protein
MLSLIIGQNFAFSYASYKLTGYLVFNKMFEIFLEYRVPGAV